MNNERAPWPEELIDSDHGTPEEEENPDFFVGERVPEMDVDLSDAEQEDDGFGEGDEGEELDDEDDEESEELGINEELREN